MVDSRISKVVALGSAASVFVGSMAALPYSLVADLALSGPLAGITGLSIWYFWPSRRPATHKDIKDLIQSVESVKDNGGVSTREVVEAVTLGNEKLDRIIMEAARIRSPNTTRRIGAIVAIGRKIVDDFRQDPKDVRIAGTWLNSYLDETIGLVKGYAQLSRTGSRSIDAQRQMAKFDGLLDNLSENFQKLLDRLLENDALAFDVNMTVMKGRLDNEGM